jgi:hypothetical protein
MRRCVLSPVIASAAKQSMLPLAETWIASSLTLLAMTGLAAGACERDGGGPNNRPKPNPLTLC